MVIDPNHDREPAYKITVEREDLVPYREKISAQGMKWMADEEISTLADEVKSRAEKFFLAQTQAAALMGDRGEITRHGQVKLDFLSDAVWLTQEGVVDTVRDAMRAAPSWTVSDLEKLSDDKLIVRVRGVGKLEVQMRDARFTYQATLILGPGSKAKRVIKQLKEIREGAKRVRERAKSLAGERLEVADHAYADAHVIRDYDSDEAFVKVSVWAAPGRGSLITAEETRNQTVPVKVKDLKKVEFDLPPTPPPQPPLLKEDEVAPLLAEQIGEGAHVDYDPGSFKLDIKY